jgi:hypothetical protein
VNGALWIDGTDRRQHPGIRNNIGIQIKRLQFFKQLFQK